MLTARGLPRPLCFAVETAADHASINLDEEDIMRLILPRRRWAAGLAVVAMTLTGLAPVAVATGPVAVPASPTQADSHPKVLPVPQSLSWGSGAF